MLVAAFFRLWLLDRIPPGLFGDEATDGLDALDVLAGRGAVFFPANYGREGLHMWLVAGMFRLLGVTPLALRLPSAIAGILTAVATYWLGRELVAAQHLADERRMTNDQRPFVIRPFVLRPVSRRPLPRHLLLAHPLQPFRHPRGLHTAVRRAGVCGVLARGEPPTTHLHRPHRFHERSSFVIRHSLWFALSGFFLGLSTHFYTASRFFPFFLGGFLVLQAIVAFATRRRDEAILVRHFWGIVLLFAVAALVFLPLGIYFIQHPGSFSQRASEVVATNAASPLALMGKAALANVLQFFVPGRGDQAQFYNLPGRAVFEPVTALLALIGLGVLLWRWQRPPALFLLTWIPALLLPSFLATDRFPTLPRVLGVIPAIYFYPAIGLAAIVSLVTPQQG